MKFCTFLILVSLAMGSFAGPSFRSFEDCGFSPGGCGNPDIQDCAFSPGGCSKDYVGDRMFG